MRDRAPFDLAIDSKLRGCDLVKIKIGTLVAGPEIRACSKATGNLRAFQILLGHTKIENTVRYLGVNAEDVLELVEATEA